MKPILTRFVSGVLTAAVLCSAVAKAEENRAAGNQNALLRKLAQKLTNHKGQPVSIVVFSPLDFTSGQVGPVVRKATVEGLRQYGKLNLKTEDYLLANLTLEEFRRAMTEYKVDVLIATVVKNSNFDMYIYDRRTPYYIFAHSEAIPEVTQLQITEDVAKYYTRLVLRRSLYRYINDQYFELPRNEYAPVLQSEIPRWIASRESLEEINRELTSRFYLSASTGAMFTQGQGNLWNAPLLGGHFGSRLVWDIYAEIGFETSVFHVFVGSLGWVFQNKQFPFKVGVAASAAYVSQNKVWAHAAAATLRNNSSLVGGEMSFLYPIGELYLKVKGRILFGLSESQQMLSFMPGILIYF